MPWVSYDEMNKLGDEFRQRQKEIRESGPSNDYTDDQDDDEFDYRQIPYIGQFVGHTADAATQGVADIFQAIGLEKAGDYLTQKVRESSARLPEMRKPEMSLDYITDPNGVTSALAQVVGSMLPMAAAAKFVPQGIGAAVGGAASRVPVIGGLLGEYLPGAVRWGLGSTPVEAMMEKGGTERDLLEQGYSREEAQRRSNEVLLNNLALLTATNTLEGALGGRLLKGISGSKLGGSLLGRIGSFAASAGGETALNAFEEAEQQGFQDSAMGKYASVNPLEWSPEQIEAAEMGVAGMAPLTLLGLPAAMRRSRTNPQVGGANNNNQADITDSNNPPVPPASAPMPEVEAQQAEQEAIDAEGFDLATADDETLIDYSRHRLESVTTDNQDANEAGDAASFFGNVLADTEKSGRVSDNQRAGIIAHSTQEDVNDYIAYRNAKAAQGAAQTSFIDEANNSVTTQTQGNAQSYTPTIPDANRNVNWLRPGLLGNVAQIPAWRGQAAAVGPRGAGESIKSQAQAEETAMQEGVMRAQAIEAQRQAQAQAAQQAAQNLQAAYDQAALNTIAQMQNNGGMQDGNNQLSPVVPAQGVAASSGEAGGYQNQDAEPQPSEETGIQGQIENIPGQEVRNPSVQNQTAQEGQQGANVVAQDETVAPPRKVAQNGSEEARKAAASEEMKAAAIDYANNLLKGMPQSRHRAILENMVANNDAEGIISLYGATDPELAKRLVAIGKKYGFEAEPEKKISVEEFEAQREKENYDVAMQEVSDDAQYRKAQGDALLRLARSRKITLDEKLDTGLRRGYKKAIKEAQDLIRGAIEERSAQNQDNKKAADEGGAVVVTGNEFGEYKNIKELRDKALEFYKKELQGTTAKNKVLGKIDIDNNDVAEFTTEGREKVKSNSAREDTLFLIKHLKKIIETADDIEWKDATSEKHKKAGDSFYYLHTAYQRQASPEQIESIPLDVTLIKHHDGSIHYYNHIVEPSKNNKNALVSPRTESSNEANVSPAVSASVNQSISQKQAESKPQNTKHIGNETTIITDEGTEIKARYKLVEADDLVTSHSPKNGLAVNPDYPAELQPRDRQRVGMKQQVNEMANKLRPEDLGESRNLNGGAPVVNGDNVVLNGNGRSIAIIRALRGTQRESSGKKYRAWLKANAEKFGFAEGDVQAMENPVLVREVDNLSDDTMQEVIGSTAGGSRLGASEQAKQDAKKLTPELLDLYDGNEKGDLTTAGNRDFVAGILHTIVGKNDLNAYTDENGSVNADGIQRVKRALFALAYGDDALLSKMAESTEDEVRNVSNALLAAAPQMARLNLKMQDGEAKDYALAKTITDAVKKLEALRREGTPVEGYLEQMQMFSEDSEEMKAVLQFLDKNKRSAKKITAFLNRAVDIIDAMGDPNQETLMEVEAVPLQDVLNRAMQEATNGVMNNLFGENEQGREQSATEETAEATEEKPKTEKQRTEKAEKNKQETKQESDAPVSNTTENIWGNETEIMDEMDAMLGKRRKSKGKAMADISSVNNKLFNDAAKYDDQAEAILKELQSELSKLSANPMFNPKVYELGLKYGFVVARRGARKFSAWAKEMADKIGEAIKPWLKSIWQGMMALPKNQGFDERRMRSFVQFVGTQYTKGNTSFESVQDAFIDEYGDRAFRENEDYMLAAYEAVNAYYNPDSVILEMEEETENEQSASGSPAENAERAGEGDRQNVVGAANEEGKSGGRDRRAGGEAGQGRSNGRKGETGVHDGGAALRGEAGNRGVQAEEAGLRDGSAGDTNLSRGVVDSLNGHEPDVLERGAEKPGDISPTSRQEHGRDKVNTETEKAGPHDKSVERDLPMLLPEQQGDVVFCENRLINNGGTGVMLTNGTGTGKTYSGLGLVKRFFDSGKKDILIVVPKAEIAKQWIEAAPVFNVPIYQLKTTKDAGRGVTITTYANFGENNALLNRNYDLVVADECQELMSGKKGDATNALEKLRAITYHNRGFGARFRALHADEYKRLAEIEEEIDKHATPDLIKLANSIREEMEPERKKAYEEWGKIEKAAKPRVLFLSATPFSWTEDIDYAEGYLFDYPGSQSSGGYNTPNGREQFFIDHFGYRMRYGKLTKPDKDVNTGVMERQFNEWLKKTGVVSGRSLKIDRDYDRGFLLTPNSEGRAIDAGFEALRDKKYEALRDYITSSFNRRKKHYLLEYLKAKESVPIIEKYLAAGKKVVVFHQSMKEQEVSNPFVVDTSKLGFMDDETRDNVIRQYRLFKAEHPELYNIGLEKLKSPIETIREAFGDRAVFFNGRMSRKASVKSQMDFNDDNSGKDIIVVQQDKGNAGVSLHDITGKHSRAEIILSVPTRPVYAVQIEGRIYRVGVKSDAVFRYLTTGTDMEKALFAEEVAQRSSTAENLSMGNQARALKDSFVNLYMETMDGSWQRREPGHTEEGTGGKEMDNAGRNDLSLWDMAKSYYYAQQKKTSRNKAQEGQDYYATPEPIGLKMVEWAQAKNGESMLEPSAGHGAISRWFSPNTRNTIIEPSQRLAPLSAMVTENANPIQGNFEDHNIINKYNAIVMNPPFGQGGKTAIEHLAKAYRHLKDGGRLVAIIPDGPAMQKRFDKWFYEDESKTTKEERGGVQDGVLMKEILLPGVTFGRAGTNVATKIVIIDKHTNAEERQSAAANAQGETSLRDVKDINELFDRLEEMNVPDRKVEVVRNTAPQRSGESAPSNASINGKALNVTDDGYITGNTYPVKDEIKKYGAKWDKETKRWHIEDKDKLKKFMDDYGPESADDREYSASGLAKKELNELADKARPAEVSEMSDEHRAIAKIGERLGAPIRFIVCDKRIRGYYVKSSGVTYINVANNDFNRVFYHELFHWMKANNEDLYQKVLNALDKKTKYFSKENLNKYREKIGRPDMSDDEAKEELLADDFANESRRKIVQRVISNVDASLAKRFMNWLEKMQEYFSKIVKSITGNKQDATERLLDEVLENFASEAVKNNYANKEGIFGSGVESIEQRNKNFKRAAAVIFTRYIPDREQSRIRDGVAQDVKRAQNAGGSIKRDELQTIKNLLTLFNSTKSRDRYNREMYAAEIEYARRCYENDYGRKKRGPHENGGDYSDNGRGANQPNAISDGAYGGGSQGNIGKNEADWINSYAMIVDGEKDDAKKLWREMFGREANHQRELLAKKEGRAEDDRHVFSIGKRISKKQDADYLKAVEAYQKAKDPDVKASVLSHIQKIVSEAAKEAGFGEKYDAARKTLAPITYDDDGNVIPLSKRFNADKDDVRYSFAGRESRTADNESLERALYMSNAGKTPQEIYEATGWFQGKDREWRYEIPDNLNKINFAAIGKRGVTSLQKIYDNPKLFEAYPFLKRIRVESKVYDDDTEGMAYGRTIEISKKELEENPEEARKTLIHEIQHLIQFREGFAIGGSAETAKEMLGSRLKNDKRLAEMSDDDLYRNLAGEEESRYSENRAEVRTELENAIEAREDAEERLAEVKGTKDEAKAKEELGKAKLKEGFYRRKLEGMPAPHSENAIVLFGNEQVAGKRPAESKAIYERGEKQTQAANKIDEEHIDRAAQRAGAEAATKGRIEIREAKNPNSMSFWEKYGLSPSKIAERYPAFKPFFEMADRAMKKLTRLREEWGAELSAAIDTAADKEGRETLFDILWAGDREAKVYTDAELRKQGANDAVIKSYRAVRSLMDKVYDALNDARKHPQLQKPKVMTEAQMEELKKEPFFAEIVSAKKIKDGPDKGKYKVIWKEYQNWERTNTVDKATLDEYEKDDAIQILNVQQIGPNEYTVRYRERIGDLTKREGYIPHFFHNFNVILSTADDEALASKRDELREQIKKTKGEKRAALREQLADIEAEIEEARNVENLKASCRTLAEAERIAKELEKNLKPGEKIIISPKVFNFKALGGDAMAVVLGDNDYRKAMQSLENLSISPEEAGEIIRMKNRHRFFGNFLERKGYSGFEKNMEWVLRHHVNTAARYVAMETEFKPHAINLFERMYGDFRHHYDGMPDYIQDYINDVNGVPSALEKTINDTLNGWEWYRKYVASSFGDRAALQLASNISGAVSVAKLGVFNISSALLNLTQIANAAAYIGDWNVLWTGLRRGFRGGYDDRVIYQDNDERVTEQQVLDDTGVAYDIGLDSGSGYDRFRPGKLAGKSMFFFKKSEEAVRRGTVLAAYDAGRKRGMDHEEAIRFADDVNRKSNFEYGVQDAPNVFRRGSIISQLLLQFKKYPIKELEVMKDMISGNTSAKQKAIFWGSYFLLAGLFQVPFGDWFEEAAEIVGLKPGPTLRKWMMQAAGDDPAKKALAKLAMYGIGSTVGADISQRYGLGGVLPTDLYLGKNPSALDIVGNLGGATVGTTRDVLRMLGALFLERDSDAALASLRGISPGVANLISAYNGKSYDRRGRVAAEYKTPRDRILKALGFRSTDEAITSDIRSIYYDEKEAKTREKQRAVDRYLDDPSAENARALKALGVKKETVKKARKQRQMNNLKRTESNMTKRERKEYQDMLRFAQ